jgi:AraC family transcriptional regulator of adaptative response/methylated-DNA-[protein]-cysteine methyltransferase
LNEHADESISLSALARIVRVSPSHLQREFKRALGLSPREFQAACRADRFRQHLRSGRDVTSAMYEAGYGSPSRIYESSPTGRGMHPATYRRRGAGAQVGFTTVQCPLGWLLVAATDKGVCAVKLGDSPQALELDLRREFSYATISANEHVRSEWVAAIVERLQDGQRELTLPLDVRGTAFQWRVWRALQRIPAGETRSYSDVARAVGRPAAVRAVANACARNPVCLVVPCHRVVTKDGGLGGYRWGAKRKARLLAAEMAGRRRDGRHSKKSK